MKGMNSMIYKNDLGIIVTPCEGHKN